MHFIPRVVPSHGAMPPESGRRALGIFSSLVALLLVSCGSGGDQPVGMGLQPASAAGVQEDIRLRDPSADGWPTEVLHDLAKPVLHHLVASVAGLPGSKGSSAFLSLDFRGSTSLRPANLVVVRDIASGSVSRARGLPGALGSPEDWEAQVGNLRAVLGGVSEVKASSKIISVSATAVSFTTEWWSRLRGRAKVLPFKGMRTG